MSADESLETLLGTAARLRPDLQVEVVAGNVEGCRIERLVDDSRQVEPGIGFVARPGTISDGKLHIGDAIDRGASLIIAVPSAWTEVDPTSLGPVVGVSCDQPLELGTTLAGIRREDPATRLRIAGITGTNGKTTVASLVRQVLDTTVARCGSIGTIEIHDGVQSTPALVTTPGRLEIVEVLGDMVQNGCELLAMEVSSHALEQGRVADLNFAVAVFTNLSGDHLDYHGTMEAYARAKARLFGSLDEDAVAIVNLDDPAAATMLQSCSARTIGVTRMNARADGSRPAVDRVVEVQTVRNEPDGMRLRWTGMENGPIETDVPLVGMHNAFNATVALLVAIEMGAGVPDALEAIQRVSAPRGRLEPVHGEDDSIRVYVDYAHTDDAIRTVLAAVRPFVPAESGLVAVIGAGGDRDRSKRPRMMRAALDGADRVVVTSDNPRTEDPAKIVAEVVSGASGDEKSRILEEVDRRRGIGRAIEEASAGDVVVIAGKGHEDYQIVGTQRRPFDDHAIAREALARRREGGR